MQLERELATYRRMLPDLLKDQEGEFVLIKGDRVEGFWKTKAEAMAAAHQRFPLQPFFVKEIQQYEQPLVLTPHPVAPCRP